MSPAHLARGRQVTARIAILIVVGLPSQPASAQEARSPVALAAAVDSAFTSGDTIRFARWFPFGAGQALHAAAIRQGAARRGGAWQLIRADTTTATVLFGGYVVSGNAGDETIGARGLAGLYRMARSPDGRWRLVGEDTPDSLAHLVSQHLDVRLAPGRGLDVTDTLRLVARSGRGVALRLNRLATLHAVSADGRRVRHAFSGGVLWLDVPKGSHRLVIRYALDLASDTLGDASSGRFTNYAGHVRGQYLWHPVLWFDDTTRFAIRIRGPRAAYVTTDLEQQVRLAGALRTVMVRESEPLAAVSLYYDYGWQPRSFQIGQLRFALFATADFTPEATSLSDALTRVSRLLEPRFGQAPSTYRAIVQQRARPSGSAGWPYMSNRVIAANWRGGPLATAGATPRAFFAHEVAHAWTAPFGSARTLLSEGWATFVESLVLRSQYGVSVEASFWSSQQRRYANGGFNGRVALVEDDRNSGIAYSKGAWVFRMLEDEIGSAAFDRAMRCFVRASGETRGTLSQFRDCVAAATSRDYATWLNPWIESRWIPRVVGTISGDTLVVTQHQPDLFPVRLEYVVQRGRDILRDTIRLTAREVRVPLPTRRGSDALSQVRLLLDPRARLLLERD